MEKKLKMLVTHPQQIFVKKIYFSLNKIFIIFIQFYFKCQHAE